MERLKNAYMYPKYSYFFPYVNVYSINVSFFFGYLLIHCIIITHKQLFFLTSFIFDR